MLFLKLKDYKTNLSFILDNFDNFDEYKSLSQDIRKQKQKDLKDYIIRTSSESTKIVRGASLCIDDYDEYQKQPYLLPDNFEFISLPGGTLMNFKELEEKFAKLETQLSLLDQKQSRDVSLLDQRLSTRVDLLIQNINTKLSTNVNVPR